MSELFSNERIIDYFITFECIPEKLLLSEELIEQLMQNKSDRSYDIRMEYEYRKQISLPKKQYKDCYELVIESIWKFLPKEEAHFTLQNDSFFSLIFTSASLDHYYCYFYKVDFPLEKTHHIYTDNPILKQLDITVYIPKYLCFTSVNPYFISFRNLLNEIYHQSAIKKGKCFKIESILNIILYRFYLPKYQTTQLLFCLGENTYSFSKSPFRSEVGIRILFSYIQIKHIVMIIIAILMNSVIIIRHSNMEIISPIINSLFELIFPIPESYALIGNVPPNNTDILLFEERIIAGIYCKDFDDDFTGMPYHSNYVLVDLDQGQSKLSIDQNENLKDKDIIPIQRISNLVNELYKVADIYQYKYYEPITETSNAGGPGGANGNANASINNNKDVLSYYQNENIDWVPQEKTVSRGKNNGKIFPDKKSILEEKVIENKIRALFFDFIIGLFEKYDETAYYTIDPVTQDKDFDVEAFVEDSNNDIKPFLATITSNQCFDAFFQNINHIVDIKHKMELKSKNKDYHNFEIKINSHILEKGLLKDFDYVYRIFMNGLEKKRNQKSYDGLFKSSIYHTISISSPSYENIPYTQTNIFLDPLNEQLLNQHQTAVEFHKQTIDFPSLNVKLEDQRMPDSIIKTSYYAMNTKTREVLSDISSNMNINTSSTEPNQAIMSIITQFNGIISKNEELLTKMFGMLSNKSKNYLKKIETKTTKSKQQVINWSFSKQANMSKANYLKSFNVFTNNLSNNGTSYSKALNEFHINFGINTIHTISFCEYCSKPNSLWDTRREYEYSQTRKKTVTKCKFCSQSFVPNFYIIDDEKPGYVLKFLSLYKKKSIVRVEYMCYEHIVEIYKDIETHKENKKTLIDLYYNICLLFGEVKCRLSKGLLGMETIDNHLNGSSLVTEQSKGNNNNNGNVSSVRNSINGNDLVKSLTRKKESKGVVNAINSMSSPMNNKKGKNVQVMNFKFDLKSLTNEKKYNQMEKQFQGCVIKSISSPYKATYTENTKKSKFI